MVIASFRLISSFRLMASQNFRLGLARNIYHSESCELCVWSCFPLVSSPTEGGPPKKMLGLARARFDGRSGTFLLIKSAIMVKGALLCPFLSAKRKLLSLLAKHVVSTSR